MDYATPTNEWNREARRAAEVMADFRNSRNAERDEDGVMVVIRDQLNADNALFIGWCRQGEVGKMFELVQFGSPFMLAISAWFPATISDVSMHLKALQKFRTRTCADNWFRKMPQVEAYLDQVRKSVYCDVPVEVETEEIKSAPETTLLPPPKKAAKKRRANKRNPKRRR